MIAEGADNVPSTGALLKTGLLIALGVSAGVLAILHPAEQIHSFEDKKEYQRAIDTCSSSLKNSFYACDPRLYFERGYSKRMLGDYAGAIADQEQALRVRQKYWLLWGFKGFGVPRYLDHNFYLEEGRNHLALNDSRKAKDCFEKALKVEKSPDVYQALASLHEKANDFAEAERAHKSSVELASNYSDKERALHLRALFYWRNHKLDQALKDLQDALAQSSCAEAHTDRGYIYIERHEYKNAIDEFSQSIGSSETERAYHGRAIAEMESGNLFGVAVSDLDKALKLDPTCESAKKDRQYALSKVPALPPTK